MSNPVLERCCTHGEEDGEAVRLLECLREFMPLYPSNFSSSLAARVAPLKIGIVTYFDRNIEDYAAYSIATNMGYAYQSQYSFVTLSPETGSNYEPIDARWNRVRILSKLMSSADRDLATAKPDPLGGKSGVNHSIELGIGNNEAGVNRSPSSMLEQYGPGVDTTGQKLAKYGYAERGGNKDEVEEGGDGFQTKNDDDAASVGAMSAVTFDATTVAASSQKYNNYADSIAKGKRDSGGGSVTTTGGGGSIASTSTTASERTKARQRFYTELDTVQATIGKGGAKVSFADALMVATATAAGDDDTAEAAMLAARNGTNVAKAVQKINVEKSLPGVGRAKQSLSSGYIHKKPLRASTYLRPILTLTLSLLLLLLPAF